MINAYEGRRKQADEEIRSLRAQVREMAESLREKDNVILHKGYGVKASSMVPPDLRNDIYGVGEEDDDAYDTYGEQRSPGAGGAGSPGGHSGLGSPLKFESHDPNGFREVIRQLSDRYRHHAREAKAFRVREATAVAQISSMQVLAT